MTHQQSLPTWILVVSSLFALSGLMVTASLCFFPQSVLKMVDLNATGVDYVIYMWAARQFALAFTFGFATVKRSASMLTLAFVFFLVMNVGDVIIGITRHDNALSIGAAIMCVLAPTMIYFINRKPKEPS